MNDLKGKTVNFVGRRQVDDNAPVSWSVWDARDVKSIGAVVWTRDGYIFEPKEDVILYTEVLVEIDEFVKSKATATANDKVQAVIDVLEWVRDVHTAATWDIAGMARMQTAVNNKLAEYKSLRR